MKNVQSFPFSFSYILLLLTLIGCKTTSTGQNTENTGILLRDGVVIDQSRNELYITRPDNKVEALSLTTGQSIWVSNEKLKPLISTNGILVCQSKSESSQNELGIVDLDITQKGEVKSRNTIPLPKNTKTDFQHNVNSTFNIMAKVINGETYISWDYRYMPLRGVKDKQDSIGTAIIEQTGLLNLNKNSRKLDVISKEKIPQNLFQQSILLDTKDRLLSVKNQQFVSKNQQHILSSEKTADDLEFNNYRWEIYENASKKKIGTIQDYRSYAPFCVVGNTIFYEIGPYIRAIKGEPVEIPLKLIAVDLVSGKELWSREIFDSIFRGTTPP